MWQVTLTKVRFQNDLMMVTLTIQVTEHFAYNSSSKLKIV